MGGRQYTAIQLQTQFGFETTSSALPRKGPHHSPGGQLAQNNWPPQLKVAHNLLNIAYNYRRPGFPGRLLHERRAEGSAFHLIGDVSRLSANKRFSRVCKHLAGQNMVGARTPIGGVRRLPVKDDPYSPGPCRILPPSGLYSLPSCLFVPLAGNMVGSKCDVMGSDSLEARTHACTTTQCDLVPCPHSALMGVSLTLEWTNPPRGSRGCGMKAAQVASGSC